MQIKLFATFPILTTY